MRQNQLLPIFFFFMFLIWSFCSIGQTEKTSESIVGVQVGNKAPDLSYTSPNGTTYTLSDIKGKLILVDFWASWCGPCRQENPHVVEAYNTYKDVSFTNGEGFTIFSISLDTDKEKWRLAIEKDNLVWEYHVSDLKGWSSDAARKYSVNSVPSNVLIDENGIIIARNLRGSRLGAALDQFIKKNQFTELQKKLNELITQLDEIQKMPDYDVYEKKIAKLKVDISMIEETLHKLEDEENKRMKKDD